MAYIDEITKQIRKAQADAVRKAGNPTVSKEWAEKEAAKTLQESKASSNAPKVDLEAVANETLKALGHGGIRADDKDTSLSDSRATAQKFETDAARKEIADWEAAADQYINAQGMYWKDHFATEAERDAAISNYKSYVDKYGGEQEMTASIAALRNQVQKEEENAVTAANLAEFESWSKEDKAALERYIMDRDRVQSDVFSGPQFDTYNLNPIVQKYGIGKVRKMAESVQRSWNAQTMEQVTTAAEKTAQNAPVLGSAATVGAKLLGAYTGIMEYAKEVANRTGQYTTLDPNNLGGAFSQYAGTVRQGVSDRIEGENGNWLRKVASIGYEGIMSAADSAARLAAGGFNPGISATIAASGSFGSYLQQYSAQGASPEQAAAAALTNAGIEYITEKIPMDELLKVGKGGWKSILKQAFLTEPTTEEISLFANVAAEAAILRDKSSRSQNIGELVANGASYAEAREQVNKELWKEAARTYAVSSVAGGLNAGGAAVANTAVQDTKPELTREQRAQQAMEELGAELASRVPKQDPVQKTEGQKLLEQAADEVLGVKPVEQTAAEVAGVEPTQAEGAQDEAIRENVKNNLWKNYRGKQDDDGQVSDGWQAVTDNSVWATALAMKEVNPDYFNAYMASAENEQLSPIIDAVINAAEDVRQESISPMAAATVINEVFEQHGERGLQQMYNPRNGNLYDSVLNRMKAVDSAIGNGETDEQTSRVKGTGAAERGFSPKYALIDQYGNIPEGENPARADQLPASITGDDRVSYTARTALEAQATPDEFAELIENETMNGGFSYIPIRNDETVQTATETIRAEGWRTARANWTAAVRLGQTSPQITATGAILYNHAVNRGDFREAMDILMDYQLSVRNSAQALQAARILKTLTPNDRLYMIRRSVERMVEDMHLDRDIEIDEDLARQYQEAGTEEEANEILDEIAADVARQIPTTGMEAFTALRYLNMLGNFRTQVRNVSGNVASKATYLAKDEIAATIEALASAVTGGRFQRTKVHIVDSDTKRAALDDFENVRNWLLGGGRYNDRDSESEDFARRVQENRRILPPVLEQYRRATNWAMETGDTVFARSAYARALAGYLNARGIRTDNLETVDPAMLNRAREYAVQQAQEQTFRDNNQVSNFVGGILRGRNTPAWARVIGEGIMPFRRTPANVLVRAEEFSPLGLINSAVNTVRAARGQITGAELVDSWAKSLTGTALFALGSALHDMGYLTGGPDPDEEKEAFEQMNGIQNYALMLPDGTNLTIDFLSPMAIPMFLGAQFDQIRTAETDLDWGDYEKLLTSLSDPLIEMSMLQGVNDTLENLKYADNTTGQFLLNAMVSYLAQGLSNTLLGQIERSTEENRMTTYIDKDSAMPEWLQRQLGKVSQKIPGLDFQQMEYRNAFGQTEKNEGGLLYNLFSPGYLSKKEETKLTDELNRLRDITGESVYPESPGKNLNYTDKNGVYHEGYNLTAQQLEKLQTAQGQTAGKLLNEIIESPDYKALTDTQKAETVKAVYEYAQEQGRKAALEDYYSKADKWIAEAESNPAQSIIRRGIQKNLENVVNNALSGLKNGWTVTDAAKKDMDESFTAYDKMSEEAKQKILEDAVGDTLKYLEIRRGGVDTGSYLDAMEDIKALKPEEGYSSIRDIQKREAIANSGLSEKAIDVIMKAYMTDYDPTDSTPDKTELRYDYTRKVLGMSPSEYAEVYRVAAGDGKKADMVQKWQNQGYSKAEAEILWNLFKATGSAAIDVESWHNSK